MSRAEFVHLHAHSEYSLLDGATRLSDEKGKPSEFLKTMAAMGMPALALTDHGNLFGAIEFYEHCIQVGLRPILGCEAYVAPGSRFDRKASIGEAANHLTLLCRDREGYQNLLQLVSAAYLEGFYYKPRMDRELLRKHAGGLLALSGCLKGEIAQAILSENLEEAVRLAEEYQQILGKGNFYLEMMDHGLEPQKQVIRGLLEVSRRTDIPLVATNDCHYFKKEDAPAHDVLLCIGTGKRLEDTNRMRYATPEFYYKSPEEMGKIFSFAPPALKTTLEIAEKCRLEIPMNQLLLPTYEVPEGFTVDSYLEKFCLEGIHRRKGVVGPAYLNRLSYELSIIQKMGFSGYFLIVWDFIRFAKSQAIPVGPGRGSGAGSIVAYALEITNVDPMEHGLLFERFLNPERRTMPDLDIDFSDEGRDRVIEYVRRKYGEANVAQIITFGSMNARLVIRDVGRVLGHPLPEVNRLAKLIPFGSSIYRALQSVPELRQAQDSSPEVKRLFEIAQKLEGLKRHTGVHAAGTVITREAVSQYSPLARSANSEVVTTQYNDESLLKLGLLKIDFLGLRTLTVISKASEMIRRTGKPDFEVEKISFGDPATYELLCHAKTAGVFQLESSGMRDLLRKLKPTEFRDIVALIALYRPGPMGSGMLDEFVLRKHNPEKIRYDHPRLKSTLQETYGTIVYQEQVMEISKELAGFTPGQADILRKAMGKKIPEELEKQRDDFIAGTKVNGIDKKLAHKVFDQLVHFGGYGFNKSHATAYGMLAYQTAYLKANHPVPFLAALLSSEIGRAPISGEDKENKLLVYLEEAKSMGIRILPPDIQKSEAAFSLKGGNDIRFGLLAIKNLGVGAVESILESRREKGPFVSLPDLCMRVDIRQVNKKVLESLIHSGALDSIGGADPPPLSRARMGASLDECLTRSSRVREEIQKGQELLFQDAFIQEGGAPRANGIQGPTRWSEHELLQKEREVLGFYLSGHPLARYRNRLRLASDRTIERISPGSTERVRLAGMILQVRRLLTKSKGEPWARFKLEDLTGEMDVLVFPKAYASGLSRYLKTGEVVAVSGRLNPRQQDSLGEVELIAEDILPLQKAAEKWVRGMVLSLSSVGVEEDFLKELRKVLSQYSGPCQVKLRVQTPVHGTMMIETGLGVVLQDKLFEELERLLGERAWALESVS